MSEELSLGGHANANNDRIGQMTRLEELKEQFEELENNKPISHVRLLVPWIMSTILFAGLAFYFWAQAFVHVIIPFDKGYPTDFADARSAIIVEEQVYRGELNYNNVTGEIERLVDQGSLQYFGPPSADMDVAWEALLDTGGPVKISEEEAAAFPGLYPQRTGEYAVTLDVLHTLDCLNTIRKYIDADHYAAEIARKYKGLPPSFMRVHVDHCLDALRQSVSCQGDLSPVSYQSWPGFAFSFGASHRHTCRNLGSLVGWMRARNGLGVSEELARQNIKQP